MDKEELTLRAKLQQKKNAVRGALKKMGVLEKKGKNTYDNYKYFSEAQYKELFTGLLADAGLELAFNELEYQRYKLDGKASEGRLVKLRYELIDMDTGYSETTVISGEAADRGDKAGYKAYTGILKYYLANTFLVATDDDPEKPDEKEESRAEEKSFKGATPEQIKFLKGCYKGDKMDALLKEQGIAKIEELSITEASDLIKKINELAKKKEGESK